MEQEKDNSALFWIFGAIIAVVLFIFFWKIAKEAKKKKEEDAKNAERLRQMAILAMANNNTAPAPQNSEPTKKSNDEFPLMLGDWGKRVEQLQTYLLRHYGWQGKVDGKWGSETQKGVEKNLKVDRITENLFDLYNLDSIKTNIFK